MTTGAAASAKVSVPETPSPPAAPPVAEAAVREQRASSDAAANAGAQGAGVAAPQPAAQRAMPTPESLERSRAEVTAATAAKLAAAPPRDPLADLDSVLRSPSDAAWQSAGRTIAHGTAQTQWWASLRASTQGRWQRTAAPREQPPWLVLLSGGRVEVSLWFDAVDGALWLRSADTYWKAPVPDEQRRTWQDTVARW